jgi:AcrR family transcriptional regulator
LTPFLFMCILSNKIPFCSNIQIKEFMPKTNEEVRERILSAARDFFSRYGLSKTTIDDIAKHVHMGKSSLYYYFKNKEEIFSAVIEREANILKLAVTDAMSAVETPQEKLHAYIVTRISLFKELANFYNVFKDEYLRNYAFIQKMRQGYDKYEVDLIKGILSRGIASGIFAIEDIDLTSTFLQMTLKGMEYEWTVNIQEKDVDKNIKKLLGILLHGIMKR